jgi:FkbM family methyltransferase
MNRFSKFFKKIAKIFLILLLGDKLRVLKMRKGLFKGILLEINLKNQLALIFGTNEIHLQKAIKEHISFADTVFDIGSHIGYVSIAMSKIVGEQGKVYSFEAIPATSNKCKRNLELNSCVNVNLTNKALSDKSETTVFRIPDGGENYPMASMIWHSSSKDFVEVEVESITIDTDTRFSSLSPTFVKIDVEGAEGKVIKGMQGLIKRCNPVIFIECSKAGREVVWDILRNQNKYNCFNAITNKEVINFQDFWSNDFIWLPSKDS